MPKVPLYQDQAQPSESSKPFIQSPIETGATEKAWQKLAGSVSVRAEKYQQEQDALTVAETISKLNDQERQFIADEEKNNQGSKAVGATARGMEFYEKQIKELSGGLQGKTAEMFRVKALQVRDQGLNRLSSHEANQHQNRKKDAIMTRVEGIRQKIREGYDQDTIQNEVAGGEGSLMDMVDQAYQGLDMTEFKTTLRDTIYKEYLDTVITKSPNSIVEATEKWKNVLPTEKLNDYLKKVDMANAIREMHKDPNTFKASDYASLDPTQQAHLQEQANKLAETQLQRKIHDYDRMMRLVEKQEKTQRESTETAALILFDQGKISIDKIQELALDRKIGADMLKYFQTRDREGIDDPMTVGEIAKLVEMKQDPGDALKQALISKKIKSNTYISFQKQIGNDKYWKGLTSLKAALEPGPLDKFNEDRNLKWENGFRYFNDLVAGGMEPEEASQNIIDGHYSQVRRTASTLPRPKFWTGGSDYLDKNAIDETRKITAQQYWNGPITQEQYQHEMQTLQHFENLWKDKLRSETQKRIDERAGKQSGGSGSNRRTPEVKRPEY